MSRPRIDVSLDVGGHGGTVADSGMLFDLGPYLIVRRCTSDPRIIPSDADSFDTQYSTVAMTIAGFTPPPIDPGTPQPPSSTPSSTTPGIVGDDSVIDLR